MKDRWSHNFLFSESMDPIFCQEITVNALLLFLILFLSFPPPVFSKELTDLQRCLLEMQEHADNDITMGEAKKQCLEKINATTEMVVDEKKVEDEDMADALDRRLATDERNVLEPFTLMAHKPNYLLIASHNFSGVNEEPFQEQYDDPTLEADNTEAKFQISLKIPLLVNLFEKKMDMYAAYTNRSFWQMYNSNSAPFRETNHEPEIWLQTRHEWKIFGLRNKINALGFVHQSNGRGGVLSRSWNRIYASILFDSGNWALGIKPWIRINESSDDDNNPDITDFLGHGELRTSYKWHNNTFSLMLRNNLESGFQKGAVEAAWSFPFWKYRFLKGYVQWFSGYGESLIDYNQYSNSLGIGVSITDWL
jgi:phospholipase A1/A2